MEELSSGLSDFQLGCYKTEAGSHPKFSLKELLLADPVAVIYP